MMIKPILILLILLVLVYGLFNRQAPHIKAWAKVVLAGFMLLGVVFVIFPQTTTELAHAVGVGRGADLVLYLLATLFIFLSVNMYARLRDEHRRVTLLARKLALIEANGDERNRPN